MLAAVAACAFHFTTEATTTTVVAAEGVLNDMTVGVGDTLNVTGSGSSEIYVTTGTSTFRVNGGTVNISAPKTKFNASGTPLSEDPVDANFVLTNGVVDASGSSNVAIDGSVYMCDGIVKNATYFSFNNSSSKTGLGAAKILSGNSYVKCVNNIQVYATTFELRDSAFLETSFNSIYCFEPMSFLMSGNAAVKSARDFQARRWGGKTTALTLADNASITVSGTADFQGELSMWDHSSFTANTAFQLKGDAIATLGGESRITAKSAELYGTLSVESNALVSAQGLMTLDGATVSLSENGELCSKNCSADLSFEHVRGNLTLNDMSRIIVTNAAYGYKAYCKFGSGKVSILDGASVVCSERVVFNGSEDGSPLDVTINTTGAISGNGFNAPFFHKTYTGTWPHSDAEHQDIGANETVFAPVVSIGLTNGTVNATYQGLSLAGEASRKEYGNHNYRPTVRMVVDGGTVTAIASENNGGGRPIPGGLTIGAGYMVKTASGEAVTNALQRGTLEVNGGDVLLKRGLFTVGGGTGEGRVIQRGGTVRVTPEEMTWAYDHQRGVIALSGGRGRYDLYGGSFNIDNNFHVGGAAIQTGASMGKYEIYKYAPCENCCLGKRFDGDGTLNVQGGTFRVCNSLLVSQAGTGTLEVGPDGNVNVGELILTNRASFAEVTPAAGFATMKFTLGAESAGTVTVRTKLVIAPTSKLVVDAGALTLERGKVTLIAAPSREGEFGSVEVVNGRGGTVVYEGGNVVFKTHPGLMMIIR